MNSSPVREKHHTAVAAAGTRGGIILPDSDRSLNLTTVFTLSFLLHALLVALIWGTIVVLDFLGFHIPLFDPIMPKVKDTVFVLVERPEATPRDKNTKNRADRATRAGGKKTNMPEADAVRKAGAAAPPSQAAAPSQPAPQAPPAQPTRASRPQPQPRQNTPRPQPSQKPAPNPQPQPKQQATPQPNPASKPTPPSPKAPTPSPTKTNVSLPPNPVAPNIKTPAPPAPTAVATGPVVRTPVSGGSSGGSSSAGPSQIPGTVSGGGGRPSPGSSPGGTRGNNGTSSYNQGGSPGGGGGPAGIDALPEPDFGPYIAELQRRIKRNWTPPADNRDKRVVAIFTVARDGRLLNVRLQNSSGVKPADDAAIAAVRASAPFRPLPPNYRGNDIDVEFIFDYTVHSGGRR